MKFIFLGLLCAALTYKDVGAATEGELTKMLLRNYVKTARPVANVGKMIIIKGPKQIKSYFSSQMQ